MSSDEVRFIAEIELACLVPKERCLNLNELRTYCGEKMRVLIGKKGKEYLWTANQSFCKHKPTIEQVLNEINTKKIPRVNKRLKENILRNLRQQPL